MLRYPQVHWIASPSSQSIFPLVNKFFLLCEVCTPDPVNKRDSTIYRMDCYLPPELDTEDPVALCEELSHRFQMFANSIKRSKAWIAPEGADFNELMAEIQEKGASPDVAYISLECAYEKGIISRRMFQWLKLKRSVGTFLRNMISGNRSVPPTHGSTTPVK